MSQRVIVIYEEATGKIRQVTRCQESDAEVQHIAWPGHGFVDVTGTNPKANPNDHAVDLQTMEIVARTVANDGDREAKRRELVEAAAADIAATAPEDITALILRAASGDADAQAEALALAEKRDATQQKLTALLDALPDAETVSATESIVWQ